MTALIDTSQPVTITLTATTDGPRQFCSAWGRPCCADGPHTVRTYVTVRVVDRQGVRVWHFCPPAADKAADLVDSFAAAYRGRGYTVEVSR